MFKFLVADKINRGFVGFFKNLFMTCFNKAISLFPFIDQKRKNTHKGKLVMDVAKKRISVDDNDIYIKGHF